MPMSEQRPWRVLFLCTANSARSILAEAALQREGAGRFEACSAGSTPRGQVNPAALELLATEGFDISRFRSKSWDEFAAPGAPDLDFIITLCDSAAGEACPVWPGRPVRAHWGLPDPASVEDETERRAAFAATLRAIEARIERLMRLPIAEMDAAELKRSLAAIGAPSETPAQDEAT
jgi:protein-tyrosine-phosphatase